MNTSDIDQMLMERESPCISILVPTHRTSDNRIQDPMILHKAVIKAKILLHHSGQTQDQILKLDEKIDLAIRKIDFLHLQDGIGIFISPSVSKLLLLPLSVNEKVVVGKNFEIRDLLYCAQFLTTYYLLSINSNQLRLFKGQGPELHEIENEDFPRQYNETYEYARSSSASSTSFATQNFEHDKSTVQKERISTFLRQMDTKLSKYLKNSIPLVVAGVEEELSAFAHITKYPNHIVATIEGSYNHDALHSLAETAWNRINEYIKELHDEILKELRESIGRKMSVDGIRDVWKAAMEGNCLTLVVEKDFQTPGYFALGDKSRIHVTPLTEKYEFVTDAVDDVMEIVKKKGGDVIIVENGELEEFDRVAMLLRYRS